MRNEFFITNEQRTFYVGYEDGEEMYVEYYDHIFEVLASYYEVINEGLEELNLVEVEVGSCVPGGSDRVMEPLSYHLFVQGNTKENGDWYSLREKFISRLILSMLLWLLKKWLNEKQGRWCS